MLKKFRLPKENPIVFQLGLVEREVHEVLNGHLTRQSPKTGDPMLSSASCDQRPIAPDDVCPICQEELIEKPQRLSYCKYGCGNSVHLKCIKIWAEHQKSQGETVINCPLCREKFSTFKELYYELHNHVNRRITVGRESLHLGVSCSQCKVCPIAGKCYKCNSCPNFCLCSSCFAEDRHNEHSFHFRQHPSHSWRSATRPSIPFLSQSLTDDLQNRELTENDYDLLLQLDNSHHSSLMIGSPSSNSGVPPFVLNSFHTEPLDNDSPLLISGASCQICSNSFQRGDWVRRIPCKHKFHRQCTDDWFCNEGHNTCPIDGKIIYNPEKQRKSSLTSSRRGSLKNGHLHTSFSEEPQQQPSTINMSISGHGLTSIDSQNRRRPSTQSKSHLASHGQSGIDSQNRRKPSTQSKLHLASHGQSGIRRGSLIHRSECTETPRKPSIGKDFSLKAMSLLSCNKVENGDSIIKSDNLSHPALNVTQNRRKVIRRGSQPVSLVAQFREESNNKTKGHLPKILPNPSIKKEMQKSLCIATLQLAGNSLPAIDAHLKDKN